MRRLLMREINITIQPPPKQMRSLIVAQAQHAATAEQKEQADQRGPEQKSAGG